MIVRTCIREFKSTERCFFRKYDFQLQDANLLWLWDKWNFEKWKFLWCFFRHDTLKSKSDRFIEVFPPNIFGRYWIYWSPQSYLFSRFSFCLKNENFYNIFFTMALWIPNQMGSSKFFRLTFWVDAMNILKSSILTFQLTKSKTQDFHFVWKMWRNVHSFTFFDNAWSLTLKNSFIWCPYKQVKPKSVPHQRKSSLLT